MRLDDARLLRNHALQQPAQLGDRAREDIVADRGVGPRNVEQAVFRDHLPRMVRQAREKPTLLGSMRRLPQGPIARFRRRLNVIGLTYAKGVVRGPALSRKQSEWGRAPGKPHTACGGWPALPYFFWYIPSRTARRCARARARRARRQNHSGVRRGAPSSRTNPCQRFPNHLKCSKSSIRVTPVPDQPGVTGTSRPSGDTAKPDSCTAAIEPLQLRDVGGVAPVAPSSTTTGESGSIAGPSAHGTSYTPCGFTENAVPVTHAITVLGAPPAGGCAIARPIHGLRDVEQGATIRRLRCNEAAAARDALGRPGPDPHPPDVAAVASRPREVDALAVARPCRGHLIASAVRDLGAGFPPRCQR